MRCCWPWSSSSPVSCSPHPLTGGRTDGATRHLGAQTTQQWILQKANELAVAAGVDWVDLPGALTAVSIPDTKMHDFRFHTYDRWGSRHRGLAPLRVATTYEALLDALVQRGRSSRQPAPRSVGSLLHRRLRSPAHGRQQGGAQAPRAPPLRIARDAASQSHVRQRREPLDWRGARSPRSHPDSRQFTIRRRFCRPSGLSEARAAVPPARVQRTASQRSPRGLCNAPCRVSRASSSRPAGTRTSPGPSRPRHPPRAPLRRRRRPRRRPLSRLPRPRAPRRATPTPTPTPTPGATLDVRSFGAVGNGSANDSAAVQRAVDQAAAGGTVFVPAGTYLCPTPVKLARGVTLLGEGEGSWLKGQLVFASGRPRRATQDRRRRTQRGHQRRRRRPAPPSAPAASTAAARARA